MLQSDRISAAIRLEPEVGDPEGREDFDGAIEALTFEPRRFGSEWTLNAPETRCESAEQMQLRERQAVSATLGLHDTLVLFGEARLYIGGQEQRKPVRDAGR
ncbi:MAG: hypothetical protein H6705_13320 [Myxococcales bacterium]|nr:hypothetical protein [Myxococcales bacterium]